MIKRFLIILGICFSLISCNEDFNPYGDEVNKYVLNCIVRADTNYQAALVSRSYIVDNLDPFSNSNDPNIYNAVVRIYNGDNFALLKDTLVTRQSSNYKTPYLIYQTRNFKPDSSAPIKVEAVLPNGKTLSGETILAKKAEFYQVEFTIPPEKDDDIIFVWDIDKIASAYMTRIGINYYKQDESPGKIYTFYVPLQYVTRDGKDYPINPKVTPDNFLNVSMETMNKAMQLLSNGDPKKKNYVILDCLFEVFSLDQNLSDYYNSENRGNDTYSIKLDESDFTVVSGAFGVVGSFAQNSWRLKLTHTYINLFDYTPGLADVTE